MTKPMIAIHEQRDGSADAYLSIPADADPATVEELSYQYVEDLHPGQELFLSHLSPCEVRSLWQESMAGQMAEPA